MEKRVQNTLLRKKRRENTFTLQPDYFDARETLSGNMYLDITLKICCYLMVLCLQSKSVQMMLSLT